MAEAIDMAVQAERPKRLFTVDEYHRRADAGIFGPQERIELIDGEIIQMSPIGPRHAGCVINVNRILLNADSAMFGRGTSLAPLAVPDLQIAVDELFV
jgi:Uma2 family endonuclease